MKKQQTPYIKRLIYGYNCRLAYDNDSECYIITSEKFPSLLEDGRDRGEATRRMKEKIAAELKRRKEKHLPIPEVDEPEWEKIMKKLGVE